MATTIKMVMKKETKHTVVYEVTGDDPLVPAESIYVTKAWLRAGGGEWTGKFPAAIQVTFEAAPK